MNKKIIVIAFCLILCPLYGKAQRIEWEEFVEQYIQGGAQENELSEEEQELRTNDLLELHQQPFNINRLKKDDLKRLPFLSNKQIDNLIEYRDKHSPIYTLSELNLIKGFDYKTVQYISLFLHVGETGNEKKAKWFSLHHNELASNISIPLYSRAGYAKPTQAELSAAPSKYYLGSSASLSVRYRYNFSELLQYGFTLEKDAGEPFAGMGNTPFDSYSFYVSKKSDGLIKHLLAGDFRANFGMGLAVGSGFMNNAISVVSSERNTMEGFSKKSSTDEYSFFRGIAATIQISRLRFMPFFSYRKIDANLNNDGEITSLKTDGYHRTKLEIEKKGNTKVLATGINAEYGTQIFKVGISGIFTHYNRAFRPREADYSRYYFKGNEAFNLSTSYKLRLSRLSVEGETSISQAGGVASIATVRYTPTGDYTLTLQPRFYSKEYVSPYSSAHSMGSRVQNELGLLSGGNFRFSRKWNMQAYAEWTHFPWDTYLVRCPSDKYAAMIQSVNSMSKTLSFLTKYSFNFSQRTVSELSTPINIYRNTFKMQLTAALRNLSLVTTVSGTGIWRADKANDYGWLASQRITYNLPKPSIKLSSLISVFNTDSYDSRLYNYEPSLLYSSSFPLLYYYGLRYVCLIQTKSIKNLDLSLRYSITHYFNKSSISSGAQEIASASKNDLALQLRYLF